MEDDKYQIILKKRVKDYDYKPLTKSEVESYKNQCIETLFDFGPSDLEYEYANRRVEFMGDDVEHERLILCELLCMYAELRNWRKFKYIDDFIEQNDTIMSDLIGHEMYYSELERVYIPVFDNQGFSHYKVECDDKLVGTCLELGGELTSIEESTDEDIVEPPCDKFLPTADCVNLGFIRASDVFPDVIDRFMSMNKIPYPEPVRNEDHLDLERGTGSSMVKQQTCEVEEIDSSPDETCVLDDQHKVIVQSKSSVSETLKSESSMFDHVVDTLCVLVRRALVSISMIVCCISHRHADRTSMKAFSVFLKCYAEAYRMVSKLCAEVSCTNWYYAVCKSCAEVSCTDFFYHGIDKSIISKFFPP